MTNESRMAFDAEWLKYTPEDDKPMTKIIAEHFWQTSKSCEQARILALLESEEMVEAAVEAMNNAAYSECFINRDKKRLWLKTVAKSAIEAIKQRINKGE